MNALYNLARVTTATVGTGTITLGGAVVGYLTFAQAGVPTGAIVSYGIADGANSEVGWGVYTAAGLTLTRNVYRSTGTGNTAPIALSGSAQVFITAVAADFMAFYTANGLIKSDGAGNIAAAVPDQDFALPAWSVDLDFTTGVYWVGPENRANPINCSRASVGYIDSLAGVWSEVAANTLRRSDKGALIEEARTNSIRNNSMQGAVAGSPGTLPNNWGTPNSFGALTRTIVGIGTENGVDYIDIRFNGTTSTTNATLAFELGTQIAGVAGETHAVSAFMSLVAGSLTNINNVDIGWYGNDSGGGFVNNSSTPVVLTAALTRFTHVAAIAGATIAYIRPKISFSWSNGVAVDFTIRIGWPQSEFASWVSSPIRTAGAAATRAADVVTLTAPPPFGSAISMVGAGTPLAPTGYAIGQYLALIDDNSGNNQNRVLLYRVQNTGAAGAIVTSNINTLNASQAIWDQGVPGIDAVGAAANNFVAAFNGSTPVTDTTGPMPATTLSRVVIGSNQVGASQWNGYIGRVLIWPETRLGNSNVQAVSASLPQAAGWITNVKDYSYAVNGLVKSDGAGTVAAAIAEQDFALPAWSVDLDFTIGVYWNAPYNPPNPLTCSRASVGYIDTIAGVWSEVAANVARRSDKGLLVEEARTNSIRNNSMQGAVAGSPGTLPTNWTINTPTGLTRTISLGTQNGIDYIEFNYSGTTTSATSIDIIPDGLPATTVAAAGDIWTGSFFASVSSSTGVSAVTPRITYSGSGQIIIGTNFVGDSTFSRREIVGTAAAGTTLVRAHCATDTISSGTAVNFTIRIGWPQLERGSWASSPIRTTSAAATRAADVVTLTAPPPFGSSISMVGAGTPLASIPATQPQFLASIDDNSGTNANRIALYRVAGNGTATVVVTAAGVNVFNLAHAVWNQGANSNIAIVAAANDFSTAFNGGIAVIDLSGAMPSGMVSVRIGCSSNNTQQWNGYISRVLIWPETRLGNSNVVAVSGSLPQAGGHVVSGNRGTSTNDNAPPGDVGELMSSIVLVGAAVPLTTGTPANVTSLALTPGDWDIFGEVWFNAGGSTNVSQAIGAINTVSATLPTTPAPGGAINAAVGSAATGVSPILPVGPTRLAVATTTTIYLIAQSTFTVSTNAAYGRLGARRAR